MEVLGNEDLISEAHHHPPLPATLKDVSISSTLIDLLVARASALLLHSAFFGAFIGGSPGLGRACAAARGGADQVFRYTARSEGSIAGGLNWRETISFLCTEGLFFAGRATAAAPDQACDMSSVRVTPTNLEACRAAVLVPLDNSVLEALQLAVEATPSPRIQFLMIVKGAALAQGDDPAAFRSAVDAARARFAELSLVGDAMSARNSGRPSDAPGSSNF